MVTPRSTSWEQWQKGRGAVVAQHAESWPELKVVKSDLDKVNVENPELAALLVHQLQEIAARGMETNQLWSSVAALRELAQMVGIGKHNMLPAGQYCRR